MKFLAVQEQGGGITIESHAGENFGMLLPHSSMSHGVNDPPLYAPSPQLVKVLNTYGDRDQHFEGNVATWYVWQFVLRSL